MVSLLTFGNTALETILVFILCIFSVISVVNFTLYFTQDKYCNHTDPIGLSLADYLIGSGIAGMFIALWIFIFIYTDITTVRLMLLTVLGIMVGIFYILWAILGGIVIFRSNKPCIKEGDPVANYTMIFWIFSVILLVSVLFIGVSVFPESQIYKRIKHKHMNSTLNDG
jgi:hypothetical protein